MSFTLYQRFFTEDRVGYGAAMSVAVIFLVSLLLVIALSARQAQRGAGMSAARPVVRRAAFVHLVLIGAALIVIAPVAWTVAAGFRTQISLLMGEFFFTPS